MGYHEQGQKINEGLKASGLIELFEGREKERNQIVDLILWFGQVAKFRCRNNSAYDSFARIVFKDIAELERSKVEGLDFETLHTKDMLDVELEKAYKEVIEEGKL